MSVSFFVNFINCFEELVQIEMPSTSSMESNGYFIKVISDNYKAMVSNSYPRSRSSFV
jgi:hypothetical protein